MYNPTRAGFDTQHVGVVDETSRSSTASYASSISTDSSGVNGFGGWQKAGVTEYNTSWARRGTNFSDSTFVGSTASSEENTTLTGDEDSSIVSAFAGTCKEDTLIIFDWDDTILPTRFLTVECGLRVDGPCPNPELRKTLDAYAQLANATLLTAMELGTVIIITNAETGWLPLTCAKFLPSLLPTVNSIYHTSARSTYEPQGFASAFDWKDQAFRQSIVSHFSEVPYVPGRRRCVISLGDSAHERMAAIYACREFNEQSMIDSSSPAGLLCKSLKFMERPDLEHLRKEQYLIQDCLAQIVRYDQDLDLCIQPQHCVASRDVSQHEAPGAQCNAATMAAHGG
ncbi:apicomplexan-conserved protein, putative [Perkinsus marinus ATCC 50983]|uniref:Apicomplexan-conserved protein, putative n=1 Tax=Perkinsus marinus (strain ATCC 50983 / TXsc) TaxID=423536 RepID=C5KB70_PERM5|nr:apicomplexan-conserved protein, putative [Perkinsus marinus ATCC 50983]EER18396.1 apicomplexan-conserved protein, putative [Perkinsus marinus ATCC 50983]|eukprot:XP_002786600.1 apicomplexan-conserved protein, putative [Perkinsus marinus ATCC 50983]